MTTETTFAYSAGTRYSDNGLHERLSSAIECLRPLGPQFASVVAAIDQLLRRLAEGRFHLAVGPWDAGGGCAGASMGTTCPSALGANTLGAKQLD